MSESIPLLTTSSGTHCVEVVREGAAAVLTGALANATVLAQAAFDLAKERERYR